MNAEKIIEWISYLGLTHQTLISKNCMEETELYEIFPDAPERYYIPEVGIEMEFSQPDDIFIKLHVKLIMAPGIDDIYRGTLPAPFTRGMNRSIVIERLGQSMHYSGPLSLPAPVRKIGGWELFKLPTEQYPNTVVAAAYLESLEVMTLTFRRPDIQSLINKEP